MLALYPFDSLTTHVGFKAPAVENLGVTKVRLVLNAIAPAVVSIG